MSLARRTQLLLDDARYARLQREADVTGRSVAAVIREAIDAHLQHIDRSQRRHHAWQHLLDQPAPDYEKEPDWAEVEDELGEDRWRRMYPPAG